ncbi:MAG: hypothetical protein ACD_62C00269G0004 [uncultured bacterium]|nr:MAG: hypothetical protein ACD_62C00269G0004 [uncultured bacterium]
MKKIAILGVLVIAVLVTASAFAGFPKINTGNSTMNKVVNTGVSTAVNTTVASDINKAIKSYNCAFKNSTTTTDTTCDMSQVINTIKSKKSALETLGLAKVYVHVKASGNDTTAYKRSNFIRDRLYGEMNWYRYNVSSSTDNSNNLAIWVEVQD